MTKKTNAACWKRIDVRNKAGELLVQFGMELSSIPPHAMRELTGQPHNKSKCTLKKGWFE